MPVYPSIGKIKFDYLLKVIAIIRSLYCKDTIPPLWLISNLQSGPLWLFPYNLIPYGFGI